MESEPSNYALAILFGMNRSGKHIYEGTVDPGVKAHRRMRGRMAKQSRKINR